MTQNSRVLAGDIFRNIVANTGLGIDDAWRAARQAALDKDIEAMPMGMHTVISQGGGTFSGGRGRVVQTGTFEELTEVDGPFRVLAARLTV